MAEIAIGTYIHFQLAGGGATNYAFQNFHSNENREYGGLNYIYAGFGFSGSTVDLQGSNIRASLVFAVSPLLLNFIQEAADQQWVIRVRTVWLEPDTFEETGTFTEEVYQVTGFQHDGSRLSLDLSSPLDAVSGQSPKRVLTQFLVGSLPATGQIAFQ
jgi:hypothetical protein